MANFGIRGWVLWLAVNSSRARGMALAVNIF